MIGSNGNPRASRMSGIASPTRVTNKVYKKAVLKKYKKLPKLGSGTRFANLKKTLAAKKGKNKVRNPGALAAAIGRKKFGASKFAQLAVKGRKRA